MKNLLDTEGTVLFPFQTEIHFIWTIFSTVKRLVIGTRDHICQKQYWSACLCILLLMAYVGLCAAVVWFVVPLAEGLYSVEICGFGTMGHASKARTTLGYR